MFGEKIKPAPLWAWILGGITAPLALTAGRCDWTLTAVVGIVCGALCWLAVRFSGRDVYGGKALCVVQCVWIGIIAGEMGKLSGGCWPVGNMGIFVPLILLALAVFASMDGAERASRIGSVLFWLLLVLYAVVLVAGIGTLKGKYLRPDWHGGDGFLAVVMLLPAASVFLPWEKRADWRPLAALAGVGALFGIWVIGTLSGSVARGLDNPFYEFSRSLSLFGVAERFEAFVSFALTLGSFSILSYLLSIAGSLAGKAFQNGGRRAVAATAALAAGAVLSGWSMPPLVMAVVSIFLWCFLPILLSGKSAKKVENRS